MKTIYDLFDAKEIGAYYEAMAIADPQDSVVMQKFPKQRTGGLKLSWFKGYNQVPVALQPSAFDTKASLRDRIGVKRLETEMPFFREAMRIGEAERQELYQAYKASPDIAKPLITKIYDDAKNLIDGANVQARRMTCSVLATGKIAVAADDESGRTAAYDYDYDPNGEWAKNNTKILPTGARWTVENKATSNPIKDIMDVKRIMRKKGVIVTEAVMNAETYEGMIASESLVKAMNPVGADHVIITDSEAQDFIEKKTQITIKIEDGVFVDENKKDKYYLETGYVVFMPSAVLGRLHFGITPEEFDLLTDSKSNASVMVVGGGIAVTSITEPHPVNKSIVVSSVVLPSFEAMDRVYSLKVQ